MLTYIDFRNVRCNWDLLYDNQPGLETSAKTGGWLVCPKDKSDGGVLVLSNCSKNHLLDEMALVPHALALNLVFLYLLTILLNMITEDNGQLVEKFLKDLESDTSISSGMMGNG